MLDTMRAQLKSQQAEMDSHLKEASHRLREWGKSLEKARTWLATLDHRVTGLARQVEGAKPSNKARADGGARKQLDSLRHELSAAEKTQDARYFDLLSKVRPRPLPARRRERWRGADASAPPQLGDVDSNVSRTRGAVRRLVATSVDKRKLGSALEKEREEVGQKLDQALGRVEVRDAMLLPVLCLSQPICPPVDCESGPRQRRVGDRVRAEVTQARATKRRGGKRSNSPPREREPGEEGEEGAGQREVKEAEECTGASAAVAGGEAGGGESGGKGHDGAALSSGGDEVAVAGGTGDQEWAAAAASAEEEDLTDALASLVSEEVQKALDHVEETQGVRARKMVEETQRKVAQQVEEQVGEQWRRKCGQLERDLRELRKLVFHVRISHRPRPACRRDPPLG